MNFGFFMLPSPWRSVYGRCARKFPTAVYSIPPGVASADFPAGYEPGAAPWDRAESSAIIVCPGRRRVRKAWADGNEALLYAPVPQDAASPAWEDDAETIPTDLDDPE